MIKPAKIVLIEDNGPDVFLIEMALTENGIHHELTRFKNGEDAIAGLCGPGSSANAGWKPDAILLDLNTPKSDGFEVLGKLQRDPHLAGVPMAIITSSQAVSDKTRASTAGVRYIEKPSPLDEFLSTVGRAVKEMLET